MIANSAADSYFDPVDKVVRAAQRSQLSVPDRGILCYMVAGLRPVKGHAD